MQKCTVPSGKNWIGSMTIMPNTLSMQEKHTWIKDAQTHMDWPPLSLDLNIFEAVWEGGHQCSANSVFALYTIFLFRFPQVSINDCKYFPLFNKIQRNCGRLQVPRLYINFIYLFSELSVPINWQSFQNSRLCLPPALNYLSSITVPLSLTFSFNWPPTLFLTSYIGCQLSLGIPVRLSTLSKCHRCDY